MTSGKPEDLDLIMGSPKFRFLRDHIINTIRHTLKATPEERQSQHLISLLKKLLSTEPTAEIEVDEPQRPSINQLDLSNVDPQQPQHR